MKIGAQARLTEHAYESGQKWREVFWSKEGRGWAFKDGWNLDREKEPQREGGEEKPPTLRGSKDPVLPAAEITCWK